MQSHDKNNQYNHLCFVTCSNIHTIPMNTLQSCQWEEQETPFNVAADGSLRKIDINIFFISFCRYFQPSFNSLCYRLKDL